MNTLSVLKVRLFCLFLTKYIKACKVNCVIHVHVFAMVSFNLMRYPIVHLFSQVGKHNQIITTIHSYLSR